MRAKVQRKNIVVIGDLLYDVDVIGETKRLCPDGPAPILEVSERHERAGGAGLTATLLAQQGHTTSLVTALADDENASKLRRLLPGIRLHAGTVTPATVTKTRLRTHGHTLARLDDGGPLSHVENMPPIDELLEKADAIIVADYGRGVAADKSVRASLERVSERGTVVWDPHPRGATALPHVIVTPNEQETLTLMPQPGGVDGAQRSTVLATTALHRRWQARAVVTTLGHKGALLCEGDGRCERIPATAIQAQDTCGAGDSFAAGLAVALAHNVDLRTACAQAVEQAGAFLSTGAASGLQPSTPAALLPSPDTADSTAGAGDGPSVSSSSRGLSSAAQTVLQTTRLRGGTVVATGGCFDLLHAGHIQVLETARALGDCLIVCLNADVSVQALKGKHRPVIAQDDRAALLTSLRCVDAVTIFDEHTPAAVLAELEPDIWVKGGDYRAEYLPEAALLARWGGECLTVPLMPARSSTHLVHALQQLM